MFQNLMQDIGYALRVMKKKPWFTATIIVTLAVGIGANTAMFSTLNAVMFRNLPYGDPGEVVMGRSTFSGNIGPNISGYDLYDYRDMNQTCSGLAAITSMSTRHTVIGEAEPDRVEGCFVTWDFFQVLGVDPAAGRFFVSEEGQAGGPTNVTVISHEYWQRRFGGDRSIIGSTLLVDGGPFTIVGVAPRGFWLLHDADIWRTTWLDGPWAGGRQWHNFQVVARLTPGVDLEEAQADIDVICARLQQEYPDTNENKGLLLTPVNDYFTEGWRTRIFLLMAALGLVLLIACGNVAGLLLARGTVRVNEMAVRSSIGASRGRLISQLLTESVLSALVAGILGITLALSLQGLMPRILPLNELGITSVSLDSTVLLFAIALSVMTGLIFGIVPAWRGSPVNVADYLRSGSRSTEIGGGTRLRNALVSIQVALSVLLLVGAGLLVRSYSGLTGVDPGFNQENLLTAELQLPVGDYADAGQRYQAFTRIVEETEALPGIVSVSLINRLPLRDGGGDIYIWDADQPPVDPSEWQTANARFVMPDYFETMQIPLRAGRDVENADMSGQNLVVVINQQLAETIYPEQDPIGKRLAIGGDQVTVVEVVGLVGDTRISHVSSNPYRTMYFPYIFSQAANMRIAIRTAGPAAAAVQPVREILGRIDRNIPLAEPEVMTSIIADSLGTWRIITSLLVVFAVIALLLSATGLYGVLAYYVNSRSHEIGVRMALGAQASSVVGMIVRRGMLLVAIGLVVGIGGALGTNRLLSDLLFEVGFGDVLTFMVVGLFLTIIALLACLLPGRRAARIDPVRALQVE